MKKMQFQLLLLLLLFFFSENTSAQYTKIILYDKLGKKVEPTKQMFEMGHFPFEDYRILEENMIDGSVKVVDYYKDGKIKMTGQYQASEYIGSVENIQTTQSQIEVRDVRVGKFEWFYKNGVKKQVSNYINDKLVGRDSAWFDNGSISAVGEYLNGEKYAKWTYYFYTGEKSAELLYKNDKVIEEQYWEKDGSIQSDTSLIKQEVSFNYTVPLNIFIQNTIDYPLAARSNGVQGTVYIGFIVRRDGSVSDIEVVKGIEAREIGEMLNREALRVVSLTKDHWSSMKIQNRNVDCRMVIPIVFRLYK
jgi:TonB family protein